jgi:hypothetical protein
MNKYLSILLSTLIFPLITICMFFLYYEFPYRISNFILQDLILFLFYIISCVLAGVIFKLIKIKLSKVILISVFVSSGITLFIPFLFYGFLPSILSLFFSVVKLFIGAIIFIFIVGGKKVINQNDEVNDWDKKFKN